MEQVYLTQATEFIGENRQLKEELLKHNSPLGWEHINFLGEYKFDLKQISALKDLRPLKFPSNEA